MSRADKLAESYELLERLEANLKDNEKKERIIDDVKYLMRMFRALRMELNSHQKVQTEIIARIENDPNKKRVHFDIKKLIIDEFGM